MPKPKARHVRLNPGWIFLSETCDFGACLRGEILQRILAHDCTHVYTLPCLVVCVRVRVPPCRLPPTLVYEGTKGGVVPGE